MATTASPAKAFTRFLTQASDMLRKVHRWTHYEEIPQAERETVETHSLTTVWLAGGMLAIEKKYGRHPLNESRILLAASIHDLGEGRMGDIGYAIKSDVRVKSMLQVIEREFVEQLFQGFPESAHEIFLDAFAVESETNKTLDGEFFNAIERIGYIQFAVPQVKKGRSALVAVLERHHEPLLAYAQKFESVRVLYEPFQEYVTLKIAESKQHQSAEEDY